MDIRLYALIKNMVKGITKGEKGERGYTPQYGVDYWTEADKAEIKTYIDGEMGDVETALDGIIAIQNELIGGDSV